MEKNASILVVDDDKEIADLVEIYLVNDGYQVLKASDGEQCLQTLKEHPEVRMLILDIMMPGIDGLEVCREIRKTSNIPILILSAKAEDMDKIVGFGTGADDYLTKPFSPRQLVARIEAVLRRVSSEAVPLTNEFSFHDGDLVIDGLRHEIRKNGQLVALTPNEYKILMTMMKYPSKVFTREELIELALGDDYDGFDRVIDTHIKNIRQKLGDDGRTPRYILTVHGTGYRFGGG